MLAEEEEIKLDGVMEKKIAVAVDQNTRTKIKGQCNIWNDSS